MKLIKNSTDHQKALERLNALFDLDPEPDSAESDEIDVLALLIETYEKEAFPIDMPDPVEAIRFRMDQQNLTQKDLVPYFGSKSKVSEVLNGKRALSLAMIRKLHSGLGIPYDVLMQEQPKESDNVVVDWQAFPLHEMKKRGLFGELSDQYKGLKDYAEDLVCKFFQRVPGALDIRPALLRSSAHLPTNTKEDDPFALWAWQVEAKYKAMQITVENYNPERLTDDFMRSLANLSVYSDGPTKAVEALNSIGIRVVFVEKHAKTYLDGAAFLVDGSQPVIALTLRYNRLDNFWFTLLHEVAHVKLHLNGDTFWILDNLDDEAADAIEQEANDLAQQSLIPSELWNGTIADEYDVEQVAIKAKVSKAIVAGRYRHEQKDHSRFSNLVKEPVKPYFE
ncbi:ImmA/IrrE family metallo-endopeptidase [Reinekea thalattae]|uniref:ImmA/IrrE family metallo-endopeptidase n=1 Tax=Reinekea thalattae TaxID=2593301 RepID=A0A5C8ZB54_9GAMM|nr:ImmA/IrrE family metallo-endopeptidase [Reinekea thalattae]TXR54509.1 ImmA/IrrE family metallo-endopeptidase [Reinekea thalattae]